jgi:hypothetical protein
MVDGSGLNWYFEFEKHRRLRYVGANGSAIPYIIYDV